jgi:hypothetical protein
MKYIDEVCAVLTDEVERCYLRSRDAWRTLTDEVSAADEVTQEQIQNAEQAHKEYIRASKEYLAIAFKKRFL